MGCEYCDGGRLILEPGGNDFDDGVAKVVGSELHVNWGERLERKGPKFVFRIHHCPMCGRELGIEVPS